ncbi:helix-turn-helix domain-containing protein [Streptomyces sp. NPDC001758]
MSEEARRPRPAAQRGPTSATVAANVRRVRKGRALTVYELADRLASGNHSIAASAISKIERGERQVTVDDLLALACALDVSPSALLLPLDDSPETAVEITGRGTVPADVAWDWVDGRRPLALPEKDPRTAMLEYQLYGRPPGRRHPGDPAVQMLAMLRGAGVDTATALRVIRAVDKDTDG